MDLSKYLTLLVVWCLEGGEAGGGGKHHDHVKIHLPEFHHHDHHKKVITIHHHHHQPKKEHHHHHHHNHKPHIPHGHFYSHHNKKVHLKTKTISKGSGHHHGSHGHHGHHGHHGSQHKHHDHHTHHGHNYGHHGYHHDAPAVPSFSHTPNVIPSYDDGYSSSYSPSIPSYDSGIPNTGYTVPQVPHVHGIAHTVKQVKVFDSLPGALPNKGGGHGYEVTEEGEDGDEAFISVNNLQNTYPATFGYVRGATSPSANELFGGITSHDSVQQSPYSFAAEPTALSGGIESFSGTTQNDPYSSLAPTQSDALSSVSPSANFPATFPESDFDGEVNSFTGSDVDGPSFIAHEENSISEETPVTFAREAGIQQTTKTGNVETVVY